MCRIFGISYGNGKREVLTTTQIANILYPALVHQGPHAWGWMTFNENEKAVDWQKFPGRCTTPIAEKTRTAMIDPDAKWLVGHVRFATHGDPKDNRNNHPMAHGNIVGVHNGVLRNHEDILKKTGREDPKTQVDSEAIFASVNKWGPKKGLARIDGDMVTVYTNLNRPHVLHIGRSHGRQLTIGWTLNGNMIFASEMQALLALEDETNTIWFEKFSTISENKLLMIRNGQIVQKLQFAPPRPKVYAPKVPDVIGRGPKLVPQGKASKPFADWLAEHDADVAKRRGAKLFPKAPAGSEERRERRSRRPSVEHQFDHVEIVDGDGQPSKPRTPNQNQKLYYYNDQVMTRAEYDAVIEAETERLRENKILRDLSETPKQLSVPAAPKRRSRSKK